MPFFLSRQIIIVTFVVTLPLSAHAQLQLTCPLDWTPVSEISGPDQDRSIYGVKASDWTKDHVNQLLVKETECAKLSEDPESIKVAYANALERQLYPNALAALEDRDQRALAAQERAVRAEEADRVALETANAASALAEAAMQAPAAPTQAPSADQFPPQPAAGLSQVKSTESPAQITAEDKNNSVVGFALLIFVTVVGLWGWNRFVRNRCPSCKTTSVTCMAESETDRWRGTKQVSERNSRGTNTRHMQTTYVKTQFDYECNHCHDQWSKVRKEELGEHSSVGRFLSGY
jgi:hypothetical protein